VECLCISYSTGVIVFYVFPSVYSLQSIPLFSLVLVKISEDEWFLVGNLTHILVLEPQLGCIRNKQHSENEGIWGTYHNILIWHISCYNI
jgi:hypothetical protein